MNNDKGFTLVEVVVALAVVAIVSTSLFQMFVTSSYVNKDAQVMDMANSVAVQRTETFKADPVNYDSTVKYYDGAGNLKPVPVDGSDPPGAIIKVESLVVTTPLSSNKAAYYPDFVGILGASLFTGDLDVKITNTSDTYEIDWAPAGTGSWETLVSLNSSTISNNTLPIEVDFPTGGTASQTINLINNSNAEAEVYVFNANDPKANPATSPPYVILNTVQGSTSVSYAPTYTSSTDTNAKDAQYDLELTVSKLNQRGWEVVIKYSDDPTNPANNAIHKYIHKYIPN